MRGIQEARLVGIDEGPRSLSWTDCLCTTQHASDRADGETLQKISQVLQKVSLSPGNLSASPLETRVSVGPIETAPVLEMPAISQEEAQTVLTEYERLETVSKEIEEKGPDSSALSQEANFLVQLRSIIARMLVQISRDSEDNRKTMNELKAKYRLHALESSDLTRTLGKSGLTISLIGFGMMLGQFPFKSGKDREIIKFLADQVPSVGGMFTSQTQAQQKMADSLGQLVLAEYNAKSAKPPEANKQEFINLLDKAFQVITSAARAS